MYLVRIMFFNLISTIIIEILIALIFKVRKWKDILNIALVNILTNPLVNAVPFYMNMNYGIIYRHISLFLLEVLAIIVEGFVYKKYLNYKKINPYLLALILNFGSYFMGELINMIIY